MRRAHSHPTRTLASFATVNDLKEYTRLEACGHDEKNWTKIKITLFYESSRVKDARNLELNSRKKQPVIRKQKAKQLPFLRRDGELVWVHVAFHEGRDFPRMRRNRPSLR